MKKSIWSKVLSMVLSAVMLLATAPMVGLTANATTYSNLNEYTLETEHFIIDSSLHSYLSESNISMENFNTFMLRMDMSYEAMLDLVGRAPFNGEKITIANMDECPSGVYDNGLQHAHMETLPLICWNADWIVRDQNDPLKLKGILNSIEATNANDWWFGGTTHELGHLFDSRLWSYNYEQMASYLAWLAIEKCGGYVYEDGMTATQYMESQINTNIKGDGIVDYVYPIITEKGWDAAWGILQNVFRSYYNGQYEGNHYTARTDFIAPDNRYYINENHGDTYSSEDLSILVDFLERCSFFTGEDIKDYWTATTKNNFNNIKIYKGEITLDEPILTGTSSVKAVVTGLDPTFDDYWIRFWKNGVQVAQYRSPVNAVDWTQTASIPNLAAGDVIKVTLHAGYWELTETGFTSDDATVIPASINTKITLDEPILTGTSSIKAVVTGLDPTFDDYWIRFWKNGVQVAQYRSPVNAVDWTQNASIPNLVAGDVIKVTLHAGYWELTETGFTSDDATVMDVLAESVTLNQSAATVGVGKEATFTATVNPADAANQMVTWAIGDSSIASIETQEDGSCIIKGLLAGSTTLTATTVDGNCTATANITVKENKLKVYFTNNKNWTGIKAYCYKSATSPTVENAPWPGVDMVYEQHNEYNEAIYSIELEADKYDHIIFTDGTSQTVDIPLTNASQIGYYISGVDNGKYVVSTYTVPDSGLPKTIKIFFSNNYNWNSINAYCYKSGTGIENVGWPGEGMRFQYYNGFNEAVYSIELPLEKYDYIIFNNGSQQTVDIPLPAGKSQIGYYITGTDNGKFTVSSYEIT